MQKPEISDYTSVPMAQVLVVDEDAATLSRIKPFLLRKGYRVFHQTRRIDLFSVIAARRIDAVLLSVTDALAAALVGAIVERHPRVAVLALGGESCGAWARNAFAAGACDFLPKPVRLGYLENSLLANLAARGAGP